MILTLSRKTDLAIKALAALGQSEDRITGERLATSIQTTTQFLPQVIGPLIRAGWVRSERGPGGGYQLMTSLDSISMLDVIEAAEGEVENGRCVLRDGPCPGTESCPIHAAWLASRDVLVKKLNRLTVATALAPDAMEVMP